MRPHVNTHKTNGLLAPFSDTRSFIAQASGLIGDTAQIQRLREAARHSVQNLCREHIIVQMETVLFEAVCAQDG